jgi:hypothetical protein
MKRVLVAFAGAKGSGKDTAGAQLTEYGWTHESFAAPIRAAACELMGITLKDLQEVKEIPSDVLGGKTLREFMQKMGTEFGREMIHPEMWLRALGYRIRGKEKVVITDLRFPNEAEFIKALGGIIIEIHRPDLERDTSHASEIPLPVNFIDHFIRNDGTILDLQNKVKEIVLDYIQERERA